MHFWVGAQPSSLCRGLSSGKCPSPAGSSLVSGACAEARGQAAVGSMEQWLVLSALYREACDVHTCTSAICDSDPGDVRGRSLSTASSSNTDQNKALRALSLPP